MPSQRLPQHETDLLSKARDFVEKPRMYKVLLHNDNYTTREFVVQILQMIFHKNPDEATQIMLHVHHNGVGMCGVYPREIAETKANQVESVARGCEFPLLCTYEENEE